MSKIIAAHIQNNPKYHELIQKRDSLAWTLSAAVCVMYFGFILMIAFTPDFLTAPIAAGSVIPVGMLIGVGVIVASCLLTGIFVSKANSVFDPLTREIFEEATK